MDEATRAALRALPDSSLLDTFRWHQNECTAIEHVSAACAQAMLDELTAQQQAEPDDEEREGVARLRAVLESTP